ncbi:uncharacterized protein LOC141915058 isoform X2 [Tubulanus polymorphus]|uniref:uncharacterized protein LOC141915058 isoform X2 n=1 Tax=Tubulanus polymorphus TaxID=672921 RepID=UPI003DA691E2
MMEVMRFQTLLHFLCAWAFVVVVITISPANSKENICEADLKCGYTLVDDKEHVQLIENGTSLPSPEGDGLEQLVKRCAEYCCETETCSVALFNTTSKHCFRVKVDKQFIHWSNKSDVCGIVVQRETLTTGSTKTTRASTDKSTQTISVAPIDDHSSKVGAKVLGATPKSDNEKLDELVNKTAAKLAEILQQHGNHNITATTTGGTKASTVPLTTSNVKTGSQTTTNNQNTVVAAISNSKTPPSQVTSTPQPILSNGNSLSTTDSPTSPKTASSPSIDTVTGTNNVTISLVVNSTIPTNSSSVASNPTNSVTVTPTALTGVTNNTSAVTSSSSSNSTTISPEATLNNVSSSVASTFPATTAASSTNATAVSSNCTTANCSAEAAITNNNNNNNNAQPTMKGTLVAALVCGIIFVVVMTVIVGKRLYDGYQRRQYSKVDYLINEEAATHNYETVD